MCKKKAFIQMLDTPLHELVGKKPIQRSKMKHAEYMNTSLWRKISEFVRTINDHCQSCGATEEEAQLQVHHSKYPAFNSGYWGTERLRDLITLCDDCHDGIHTWCERWDKKKNPIDIEPGMLVVTKETLARPEITTRKVDELFTSHQKARKEQNGLP